MGIFPEGPINKTTKDNETKVQAGSRFLLEQEQRKGGWQRILPASSREENEKYLKWMNPDFSESDFYLHGKLYKKSGF